MWQKLFCSCLSRTLPDVVRMRFIFSADERHMNVLSAHSLFYWYLTHSLVSVQASPVDKNIYQNDTDKNTALIKDTVMKDDIDFDEAILHASSCEAALKTSNS